MSEAIVRKTYTCIICPNGCDIEAEIQEGEILSITGHTCPKGEAYVRQELTAPTRTIATSVLVLGGEIPLASVRLTNPIPKAMIFPAMKEIKKLCLTAPVTEGTVVLKNVCGLDSDVIVTKNVKAKEGQKLG